MKVAHLILAHENPRQLERLITRLSYDGDAVFIHLDKKTDIIPFLPLQQLPGVFFINNRVKVYWGTYSIVEATVNSFEEIMNAGVSYDYINLLSGADYPLQPIHKFRSFLAQHPGKAFMSFMDIQESWTEAVTRITQYHLNNFNFPGQYLLQRFINLTMPERAIPDNLIPVGRSQWFTASAACINYILDYWHQNPRLRRFLQFTWGCDEFIFQTILYNSPFYGHMVNNNLRHIDWSAQRVSPKVLTLADQEVLLNSDAFFARKFDIHQPQILDIIDERLLAQSL
ncbi:beta-1,6-N-acetylglucosaminyltransferase [Mucilaginibacter lacusdianchii]|uniref:beta-1,6-N-acetylglucosaminyltransferase n=1 Tax=Mucilaginibacter lacusdianchii TaxID=2684211 RepID=UPI00131EBA61|nr:beta-1,6-N-acetylglucosaminyltransferase [Mucilaginibacter sp. JXJ CY 39]